MGKRVEAKQQGLNISLDRTGVIIRKEGKPAIRVPNANIMCTEDV